MGLLPSRDQNMTRGQVFICNERFNWQLELAYRALDQSEIPFVSCHDALETGELLARDLYTQYDWCSFNQAIYFENK